MNKRLSEEVSEKDKLLHVNERRMFDYETMINQIQEDAKKEISEKERFTMLKAQDKEIHERDIEIKRLQSQLNLLKKEDKIEVKIDDVDESNDKIEVKIDDVDESNDTDTQVIESEITEIDADEESEEDELNVDVIKYRKKEFYIIVGESPQYIYEITDEGLGQKVGEIKGKRKVFYKKSK